MKRLTALTLFLLLLASCKKREEPVLPPGLLDSQGRPLNQAAPAPPPAPIAAPSNEPSTYDFERPANPGPGALTAPSADSTGSADPQPATADAGAQARDLNAEFSAQLGRLSTCVDAAKAATQPQGKLVISVVASVMATGTVLRARIDAPGQPDGARSCMERAVTSLRLAGDVPDAPLRVTGSTEIQVQAAVVPDAGTAAAPPLGPLPAAKNPNIARPVPGDVARPEPGDVARPEPPDLAGPP